MYYRGVTPKDYSAQFVDEELRKVEQHLMVFDYLPLRIHYAAPEKPQVGLYVADGTSWNPGGTGAGVYYFNGSTYAKL